MPKTNFETFYYSIKSFISPYLINNPSFFSELERIYESYLDDEVDFKIEDSGKIITFSNCQPNIRLANQNNCHLRIITISTYMGELIIREAKNQTCINTNRQESNTIDQNVPNYTIYLSYCWQYFNKDGLEMERSGLTTHYDELSPSRLLINYSVMYSILMKYLPYFAFDTLPNCQALTNYKTTSKYRYRRYPHNLALVEWVRQMCKSELDEKFKVPSSQIDQERIREERNLYFNQKGATQTNDGGLIIQSSHLLIGTYPQLLDFIKEYPLTEDDLNTNRYGSKYFLGKLEASLIKTTNPNLYNILKEKAYQQFKNEQNVLKL